MHLYYIIPLLYEEKEYLHQDEIMYSVYMYELRKHSITHLTNDAFNNNSSKNDVFNEMIV